MIVDNAYAYIDLRVWLIARRIVPAPSIATIKVNIYIWKKGTDSEYFSVNNSIIIWRENKNTINIIGNENDNVFTTNDLYNSRIR